MGIIRAVTGAIGGALADSWQEVIEPSPMGENTCLVPGQLVTQNGRSQNRKGSENIVSNGSIIHVYDNQFMMLIDGGKGQLSFAYEALAELGIIDKVTLIALAERMEEVYRVGDPYPMFIDRNSPALKVLQHIRDEAHRFGITFHRKLRSKAQVESVLSGIKGVGPKTEQRLIMHFGSVARIAAAPQEEVAALVGPQLAGRIQDQLNKENEN